MSETNDPGELFPCYLEYRTHEVCALALSYCGTREGFDRLNPLRLAMQRREIVAQRERALAEAAQLLDDFTDAVRCAHAGTVCNGAGASAWGLRVAP